MILNRFFVPVLKLFENDRTVASKHSMSSVPCCDFVEIVPNVTSARKKDKPQAESYPFPELHNDFSVRLTSWLVL